MQTDEIISDADLARRLEGLSKHLEFAQGTIEAGWNANSQRERAFNFTAALDTIKNVKLEQQFLIEHLYTQHKLTKKKG